MIKKLLLNQSKTLLQNKNFSYTVLSKITDTGFKFIILILLMYLSTNFLVEYTYFLSLSAILSVIIDFGTSRENIRAMINKDNLTLNFNCLLIAIIAYLSIKYLIKIKFYNNTFLLLCVSLAFINAWKNTFVKYFEYINQNHFYYKIQTIVNFFSFSIVIFSIFILKNLVFAYVTLLIANTIVLLIVFFKKRYIKISFNIVSFFRGAPFLLNSIASMAFSQINIVVLNQFSTPLEISNFVIAQRFIDLSLIVSNSFTSSEIGKFFKNQIEIHKIRNKAFIYWLLVFLILIPVAVALAYIKEDYKLVTYMYLALLPLGLVKSITPTYSIVMDYTKYYYLRTLVITVILGLNIFLSKIVYEVSHSIYYFIIFIDFLIFSLLIFYFLSFKKLKIYENYHS